jgi:hypothetical protein
VTVDGKFTGAGILVMRNVPLVANGSFRWEGLILVTGTGVSFRVVGDENKDIYGAIMINETGSALASPATLALEGAIRVFYSQSALATAANLIPSATLANIYGSLPSVITQNFWRSVNP